MGKHGIMLPSRLDQGASDFYEMKFNRTLAALICGLSFVWLSGCDTAEQQELIALTSEKTFTFEVNGATLTPGKRITLFSDVTDVSGDLSHFALKDIVTATVTTINLQRLQPAGMNLDEAMSSITVLLEPPTPAPGAIVIGTLTDVPASDEATIRALPQGLVAPFLQAGAFRTALQFEVADTVPDRTLRYQIKVTFSIGVRG